MAEGESSLHPDIALWRECVRHWFPKLHERAYFVPPVYMNRIHHRSVRVSGEIVDVPQAPVDDQPPDAQPALQLAHVRYDQTQQRVLHCVQKMAYAQGEPMVVISQLQFGDFLRNPCYAPAAKMLPRPVDLQDAKKRKGDFDLLCLHKVHGLVVAEIKTLGDNFSEQSLTEQQQDELVAKEVKLAIKQLAKSGEVLAHLVSDQQSPPRVRKTLMLPNVPKDQLRRVLDNNLDVKKELCKCLDLEESANPVDYCPCAELLSDRRTPYDVADNVLKVWGEWWDRLVGGDHVPLSDDAYEDLVARFAGPATTLELFWLAEPRHLFRSEGDGVHETSFRFTRVILHPHQLDVLNMNEPLVWLCGPPGTGKTLVLAVRAKDWWCRGGDVHVFSSFEGSLAASHLIFHQLEQVAGSARERIHLHKFNFKSSSGKVETAVKSLLETASKDRPLCVVVDEAYPYGNEFIDFCNELHKKVEDRLYLWAASMFVSHQPPCLTEVPMTEPLRTPPVVTREVKLADSIHTHKVLDYTDGPTPPPTDGPVPRVLMHEGPGHSTDWSPAECAECGVNVARVLKELHVHVTGPKITILSPTSSTTNICGTYVQSATTAYPTTTVPIPAPLKYSEVFLLTAWDYHDLYDDVKDAAGHVTKPASGIIRGMRSEGVPVRVIEYGDSEAVRKVAVMEGPDEVVAAYAGTVSGLERPVVVWVQTHKTGTKTVDEDFGRLMVISRTTGQLIRVKWPFEENANKGEEDMDADIDDGGECEKLMD